MTREVAPPASTRPPANVLCGDVLGASSDAFAAIAAMAEDSDTIEIQCADLRRMDFVSAGALLNLIAKLQLAGKVVRLFDVNALVEGLFIILGIDRLARIERSKKV